MKLFVNFLCLLILAGLTLSAPGCGTYSTPSPDPVIQPTHTSAPTRTSTQTSTPNSSTTPTPTAEPSPTSTTIAERIGEVALVTRVLDGDTIDVQIGDQTYRVRYIGIDSPEDGQPNSQEATEFNRQLVEGKKVILEKDVSETDRYERLLRYVYLPDGTFINAALVGAGLARAVAYPPDVKFHEYLAQMEQEAQANSLGIWAPAIEATPVTRSGEIPGTVFIDPACSQFNAPGNDNDNKVEEYVCITNPGNTAVDMSGWTINDEYGWKYTFPAFYLEAGASVRLRTGCGGDTSQDLYWCRDETAIWNNGGDCAYLSDSSGVRVHEYCY